jgi:hypothetical protein
MRHVGKEIFFVRFFCFFCFNSLTLYLYILGNHMLAFITLTVFGPYALNLMFGIFCSLVSIACSLCGIGLKIVPLLVLATVLQKSYKSIRGDKDKDKVNN